MIAIGLGCRRGCAADEIVALVREALAALPDAGGALGLFSIGDKAGEPGLAEAATRLGLPLTFLDADVLRGFADRAETRSARVEALHGLPSVAETAALAGAGADGVLLVPRRATPRATCAIAVSGGGDVV